MNVTFEYVFVCVCIVCDASRYVGARVVRRGDDMCIDMHRQCATLNVPGAVPKLSGGISRFHHRDKKTI